MVQILKILTLKIKENYVNKRSDKSAIWDSKWQKDVDTDNWPTYEIYPGSPWNYGLILNDDLNEAFEVVEKEGPKIISHSLMNHLLFI